MAVFLRCFRFFCSVILLTILALSPVRAQESPPGLYIIYDSSNSMWGALPDGSRKYEAARIAMRSLAVSDFGDQEIALRMYGHRRKNDCSDSQLVLPFSPAEQVRESLVSVMESVRPTGRTPIDLSLRQALGDFGDRKGSIVLISDGIESCDADPCALVRAWKDKQIDITVHVVGLGLKGKERAAMECIADAAGTPYRDAYTADELFDSITTIVTEQSTGQPIEPGNPEPAPQSTPPDFALIVETPDGVRQLGAATLTSADGVVTEIKTFQRYTPAPGKYTLTGGVTVIGGAIYKSVTTEIIIAENGRTTGILTAPIPPSVSAEFSMQGDEIRATLVNVFQDGKKVGNFKGGDEAFLPEGTFKFSTRPAGSSQELHVSETFAAGDSKKISFVADIEVHVNIMAKASSNGERIKGSPGPSFWQHGVEIDHVNSTSGGLMKPGQYSLLIDNGLNRFTADVVLTEEAKQVIEIEVPTGVLNVTYLDVNGDEEKQKRIFIKRLSDNKKKVRSSNKPVVLVPGQYLVIGWPKKNKYPQQEIEIATGQEINLTLKATK